MDSRHRLVSARLGRIASDPRNALDAWDRVVLALWRAVTEFPTKPPEKRAVPLKDRGLHMPLKL